MKRQFITCVLSTLPFVFGSSIALAHSDLPSGPVKVEYFEPEKFTDVRERSTKTNPEKNQHLAHLRAYLQKEGMKFLNDGQSLHIRFTDIDLAGDIEPNFDIRMRDVRILKDMYPPRLTFSWEWKDASGTVIKSGEENIRDFAFMMGTSIHSNDTLRHEKRMLDKWFKERFK